MDSNEVDSVDLMSSINQLLLLPFRLVLYKPIPMSKTYTMLSVFKQGMGTIALTAGIDQLRPLTCSDLSNCPQPSTPQMMVLFSGLVLLAVGAGGIRACNIAFGADQFDTSTEKGKAQLASFFDWWYLSFTLALLVALTVVVYIQTNISWFIGFIVPTALLLLSIFIFVVGRHFYIYMKPQGSVFVDMVKVLNAACRKKSVILETSGDCSIYDPHSTTRTERFMFLDRAAIIVDPSELNDDGKPKNGWRLCSVQQVEQLKCLLAVFPVWVAGIITFISMDQQNIFGILQAIQTNKSLGRKFKMPAGWMGLMSMIALSSWIFIYEGIYMPLAGKLRKKAVRLTMQQRIKIGIIMAILCMLVAGLVERKRRDSALKNGSYESPTSVAILVPQFVLSGLIEAFGAVAIMEFLTIRMPESMRTVAGAVFFLSLSFASYLSSIIVNVIHALTGRNGKSAWLGGHDLNKNRLDYYYFIILGLEVINLVYFHFFASRYVTSVDASSVSSDVELENSKKAVKFKFAEDEEKGL